MKEIRIKDRLFAHAGYSTDFQESRYLTWNRDSEDRSITFYTDTSLEEVEEDVEVKIAWLLESKEIMPFAYEYIEQHQGNFDTVFTHSKAFLDKGLNFAFAPAGGCWIPPEDQKVYEKSKLCSIIASAKTKTGGHRLRHEIIQQDSKLEVFGREYHPIDTKLEGLREYMFSVAIENCREDYYFTEKLIDCFQTGTVPIYWGCPHIEKFFDPRGMIQFKNLRAYKRLSRRLSGKLYQRMLPYVKDNFERSKKYLIAEDVIWEHLFPDS